MGLDFSGGLSIGYDSIHIFENIRNPLINESTETRNIDYFYQFFQSTAKCYFTSTPRSRFWNTRQAFGGRTEAPRIESYG